jgi:hypothetical protein
MAGWVEARSAPTLAARAAPPWLNGSVSEADMALAGGNWDIVGIYIVYLKIWRE